MGFFSKDIKTMNDLFMHGLEDPYYAESQIAKSLPDMIEKATNPQLRAGFEKHLKETEGQIARLEQVFKLLDAEPKGEKCPAIDGILKEGKELMGEIGDEDVMNVGIIAAAQAVEHYEITRYGALIAWASASRCSRQASPKKKRPTRNSRCSPNGASTRRARRHRSRQEGCERRGEHGAAYV